MFSLALLSINQFVRIGPFIIRKGQNFPVFDNGSNKVQFLKLALYKVQKVGISVFSENGPSMRYNGSRFQFFQEWLSLSFELYRTIGQNSLYLIRDPSVSCWTKMDILASWVVHMTVTLLLYTCIRIPMLYLLILGLLNSVVFELFVHFSRGKKKTEKSFFGFKTQYKANQFRQVSFLPKLFFWWRIIWFVWSTVTRSTRIFCWPTRFRIFIQLLII